MKRLELRRQYLTNNACYKAQVHMTPKGILVHSTGANNPYLKRYVQPNDGRLGENANGNDWNRPYPGGRSVCVHAFIGKLADGSIAVYQTLPWDIVGWHSGSGSKGSANNMGYIGFEICEDDLTGKEYFAAVYEEAAQLCAYLCREYGIAVGNIICHSEGHKRGVASDHADVMHWWPRHGKNMDTFRARVSEILEDEDMTQEKFDEMLAFSKASERDKAESEWSDKEGWWDKATALGIVDGSAPRGELTREQFIAVLGRLGLIK